MRGRAYGGRFFFVQKANGLKHACRFIIQWRRRGGVRVGTEGGEERFLQGGMDHFDPGRSRAGGEAQFMDMGAGLSLLGWEIALRRPGVQFDDLLIVRGELDREIGGTEGPFQEDGPGPGADAQMKGFGRGLVVDQADAVGFAAGDTEEKV